MTTALIPNRFLFDFEFPLRYRAPMPGYTGALRDWTDAELLPGLGAMDDAVEFGQVWACWNETGIAIACRVEGKHTPLQCDPDRFWAGDNLRLCTDMRDTRRIRRGSRFCQQFFFLPTGGGVDRSEPVSGVNKLKRAREDAPAVPSDRIEVASRAARSGYSLEAFVPAACLSGFDPAEHPRIGFYYMLEDGDHGQQYLTVGDELNWHIDPSTWATAVLVR